VGEKTVEIFENYFELVALEDMFYENTNPDHVNIPLASEGQIICEIAEFEDLSGL
jgi:hypothetical protein